MKDSRGREIQKGGTIAHAMRSGTRAVLVFCEVLEVHETRVRARRPHPYRANKFIESTLTKRENMVVVDRARDDSRSGPLCLCPATSEYDPPCPAHGVLGIGVTGR